MEDIPYTKKQLFDELKNLTYNFSTKKDYVIVGYEEEKNLILEILSEQGYNYDTNEEENNDWYIYFWKENLNEGYSKYGFSYEERNDMIYIYSDGEKIAEFPDKEAAEEAGYDLSSLKENMNDNLHPVSENFEVVSLSTFKKDWNHLNLNEAIDSTKAQEVRKNSNKWAVLYGYKFRNDPAVELEPEELTEDEWELRKEEIIRDYDGRGRRSSKNAKETDFIFYVLYDKNFPVNEECKNKTTIKEEYNIGSNKLLSPDSNEYQKLEELASLFAENSPNQYKYEVKETYEDYGAGMKWHNIICYDRKGNSWQVLNTKEWLDLINGNSVENVYTEVVNGDYFQDRNKKIEDMNMWEMFESIKD